METIKRLPKVKLSHIEIPFTRLPNYSNKAISDDYKLVKEFFVSKTRLGDGGHALSPEQFIQRAKDLVEEAENDVYWAIVDEGQFQLYVSFFVRA